MCLDHMPAPFQRHNVDITVRRVGISAEQHARDGLPADKPLGNEDFFNHQLRGRIEAEQNRESNGRQNRRPRFSWTIGRLVWTGATALALFVVCTFFVMRSHEPADQSQYLSQILNARVDPQMSPYATVSMFQTKEDKVTVLWVDGLQSLPAEYAAK